MARPLAVGDWVFHRCTVGFPFDSPGRIMKITKVATSVLADVQWPHAQKAQIYIHHPLANLRRAENGLDTVLDWLVESLEIVHQKQ
jgi:hypothetical protein